MLQGSSCDHDGIARGDDVVWRETDAGREAGTDEGCVSLAAHRAPNVFHASLGSPPG